MFWRTRIRAEAKQSVETQTRKGLVLVAPKVQKGKNWGVSKKVIEKKRCERQPYDSGRKMEQRKWGETPADKRATPFWRTLAIPLAIEGTEKGVGGRVQLISTHRAGNIPWIGNTRKQRQWQKG